MGKIAAPLTLSPSPIIGLVFGLLFTGIPLGAAVAQTAIAVSCGSVGIEFQVCESGVRAWEAATGHRVNLVSTPNDSNERLALYQQLLAAKSGDIDVFQIDVVWPGILSNHLIDLRDVVDQKTLDQHFKAIVTNDVVDGRLVAIPWFTDAGLFYYRKDLLEKYGRELPETWQEMTETARFIQKAERDAGNSRMWGYVFQGRAYEGLTVNALEWLDSFNAGTIVDLDGKITVNNPRAADALTLAASWINDIAPQGVLNYSEEECRGVFQSGNAVFMRNWPYAWPLMNAQDSPVKDRIGVAPLLKGGEDGKRTSTLGGWQLAVSKYSKNPRSGEGSGPLPDQHGGAEAPRGGRRLQPHDRRALQGRGRAEGQSFLWRVVRDLRQRGSTPGPCYGCPLQSGFRRVLERCSRHAVGRWRRQDQSRGAGKDA